MAKIHVQLRFESSDGRTLNYEKEISTPDHNSEKSTEYVAQRMFNELLKNLFHKRALDALPDPYSYGLYKPGKHSFSIEKVFSGAYSTK